MHSRRVALLFLAACKGNSAVPSDSPPVIDADIDADIDAAPDAPPDAADESTRVEIVVRATGGTGLPDPDAIAIFRDPSGNVLKHGKVDATGKGFAYMPLGGDVIVLRAKDNPQNLFERFVTISVVRGVKPGDRLKTGADKVVDVRTGIETFMDAAYTPAGGGNSIGLLVRCGTSTGSANPKSITFYASCVPASFDVLAIQDDANLVRKFVFVPGVTYASGGAFTIPNAWQTLPHSAITYQNLAANLGGVFTESWANVEGLLYKLDSQSVQLPPAGTSSNSVMYAPLATPTVLVSATSQGIFLRERFVVVTNTPATATIDWGTLAVPYATQVQQSLTGIAWNEVAAGSPDGRLVLWGADSVDGNGVTRHTVVDILEPQGSTGSTLPSLPSAYSADDPKLGMNVTLKTADVQYFDYDNFANYDAVRPYGSQIAAPERQALDTPHNARISFKR